MDGKNCTLNNKSVSVALYHIEGKFEYPFDGDMLYTSEASGETKGCVNIPYDGKATLKVQDKHTSEAQFFVFTGVFTFMYCLFACLYYAVLENPDEHIYSTDVGRFSWVVVVSSTVKLIYFLYYFID